MRIFYCVHNYNWEDKNLCPALIEMGHEVIKFDWGIDNIWETKDWEKFGKPKLNELILNKVKNEHSKKPIDLFFSYLYKYIIYPDTIKEIKRLGIPTVNFSCNDIHQFYLVDEIAPFFDYCMVTEKDAIESFKNIRAKPVYIQLAANPNIYKPYKLNKEFDVTFVGQRYGDRTDLICYLYKNNINIKVWGKNWFNYNHPKKQIKSKLSLNTFKNIIFKNINQNKIKSLIKNNILFIKNYLTGKILNEYNILKNISGPVLNYDEVIEIYNKSRITLGFLTCGNTHMNDKPLKQIRLREFEAPMSGAFYITEYIDELRDFYEIDKEIVCYSSKEELLDKILYYLKNPNEMEKISKAGYNRAIRDHTWTKRFDKLFKNINLKE